jgi:hypothetical protein
MIYLRQSTASQEVPLGYFVSSTDGDTAMTALTIANTDIKLWVNGATTLANKNSGGATHIAGGVYYTVLDATDTATIGPLVIFVHVATALAVRVACMVLDEAVYDAWFGTVALATATNITAGTITTATNVTTVNGLAAGVITAAAIATDAIDNDALAANAVTEIAAGITIPSAASIADAVWDEATVGHTTAGTFGEQVKTDIDAILEDTGTTLQGELDGIQADTEDIQTRLGTPSDLGSGATVAANLVDIEGFADNIPALQTSVDDLPTNAELATALAGADDAVLAAIAALNNLSQANIRTALGMASANLDTQLADLPTNAELATALAAADDAILAAIAALNNLSAVQVNAEVVDVLTVDVIADSTPALGSRPTIAQGILMTTRFNNGRETVAGVSSVLKEDMATESYELTLGDPDDPSSVRRTG